jgi:hypothetical protein
MKTVLYSNRALNALRKYRSDANAIMAKIERYAATGAATSRTWSGEAAGDCGSAISVCC